jgi:hypothetical protein
MALTNAGEEYMHTRVGTSSAGEECMRAKVVGLTWDGVVPRDALIMADQHQPHLPGATSSPEIPNATGRNQGQVLLDASARLDLMVLSGQANMSYISMRRMHACAPAES